MRSVDLLIIILCALSVAMSMIWLEHFVCFFCKGEKDD